MNRTATTILAIALFAAGAATGLFGERLLLAPRRAAAPAAAEARAPNAPAPTDVKNFGDWIVRCIPGARPPCEMVQAARNKQGQPVMSMAIAWAPRLDRHALQITTPVGVSLGGGVKIETRGFSSQPLPFRRCDAARCFVQGDIAKDALDALGSGAPAARLIAAAPDGRAIALPLSLRGFAEARAAMEQLAREKIAAPAR